jgi:antibiotic biosynthesis monooxygenase (ABM) superfamily enzyme
MAGGYWTFFDRPVRNDPLWRLGIIAGTALGLVFGTVHALRDDFEPVEFVLSVVGSAVVTTYWVVGLIGGTIREFLRGRNERSGVAIEYPDDVHPPSATTAR